MEFKVNAQIFHALLKKVSQCIPSRTSLDIAKKFRIRIEDGVLYVAANNTMSFAEISMDIECQNNCSFTLYATEFVKIVSKLEGEIKFTLKEGENNTYKLTCKHSSGKINFIGYSSEYFEEPTEFDSDDEMYISHAVFYDAVSKIKHSVFEMQDNSKHSIYIDVYGSNAFFVSTNNSEISCIKKEVSCEKNMNVLLNYDFVPLIMSLINKNDNETMMMIKNTERRIYFFSSNFKASVGCFASDLRFPNYKSVLSRPLIDKYIRVSKNEIIKSLDRLSIASAFESNVAIVSFNIEGNNMHLSSIDSVTKTTLEENITVIGELDINMNFNSKYLKECIENIDCDYVRIQFGKEIPYIKVSSAEKQNDSIDHVCVCIAYVITN